MPPSAPSTRLHYTNRYNQPQVTAQCREAQTAQFMPLFEQLLKSYTPPPKAA